MVTAEAALVIPVLLAVTLTLSWAIALGAAQVQLIDAAREGARLAARGEPAAVVNAAVVRTGPDGVRTQVSSSGDVVTVTVHAEAGAGVPLLGELPAIVLRSQAVATVEGHGSP